MLRRLGVGIVSLCCALGLISCGGSSSFANNNPTVTGVAVTSSSGSVNVGGTMQLTALATYSDGSSKDVTSQAAWSQRHSGGQCHDHGGVQREIGTLSLNVSSLTVKTLSVTAPFASFDDEFNKFDAPFGAQFP
jgi:hypothetical protein